MFRNVKMIVCDMAGTVINEHGIVYNCLYNSVRKINPRVTRSDMRKFYGYDKRKVIQQFINHSSIDDKETAIKQTYDYFQTSLEVEYETNPTIQLIDEKIPRFFEDLRENNIKVCLNTGYNRHIKDLLIHRFDLQWYIDDSISSEEVPGHRPEPYMINTLANRNGIKDKEKILKVGDTFIDIMEGKQAGCLTAGVLSGADSKLRLLEADPDIVVDKVTDLQIGGDYGLGAGAVAQNPDFFGRVCGNTFACNFI
jgi:phosphonatase-like hydrolase